MYIYIYHPPKHKHSHTHIYIYYITYIDIYILQVQFTARTSEETISFPSQTMGTSRRNVDRTAYKFGTSVTKIHSIE